MMFFPGGTVFLEGNDAGLPTGNSPMSVAFYINMHMIPGSPQAIFAYGTGATGKCRSLLMGNGNAPDSENSTIAFDIFGSSVSFQTLLNDGKTHLCVFTVDSSGNCNLWVDGVADAANPLTSAAMNTTLGGANHLSVGYRTLDNYGQNLEAILAYLTVWNTALSPAIAQQISAGVIPITSNSPIHSWELHAYDMSDSIGGLTLTSPQITPTTYNSLSLPGITNTLTSDNSTVLNNALAAMNPGDILNINGTHGFKPPLKIPGGVKITSPDPAGALTTRLRALGSLASPVAGQDTTLFVNANLRKWFSDNEAPTTTGAPQSGDTTLTLNTGQGAKFTPYEMKTTHTGGHCPQDLQILVQGTVGGTFFIEHMLVTAISGDVLTVTRNDPNGPQTFDAAVTVREAILDDGIEILNLQIDGNAASFSTSGSSFVNGKPGANNVITGLTNWSNGSQWGGIESMKLNNVSFINPPVFFTLFHYVPFVTVQNCNFVINDLTTQDGFNDGVHIKGAISLLNVSGTTINNSDNCIALNYAEAAYWPWWGYAGMGTGDVAVANVNNVNLTSRTAVFSLFGNANNKLGRLSVTGATVTMRDISPSDHWSTGDGAVMTDYTQDFAGLAESPISFVSFKNTNVTVTANSDTDNNGPVHAIKCSGAVGTMIVDGFKWTGTPDPIILYFDSTNATRLVGSAIMENINIPQGTLTYTATSGVLQNLVTSNVTIGNLYATTDQGNPGYPPVNRGSYSFGGGGSGINPFLVK